LAVDGPKDAYAALVLLLYDQPPAVEAGSDFYSTGQTKTYFNFERLSLSHHRQHRYGIETANTLPAIGAAVGTD
jgi:hypothetical protein